MKTVVIAEKPDLARAIASAYNPNYKKEKAFLDVGNNVYVTWCYGHMLALKEPRDINPEYRKWNINHLPYKELLTPDFVVPDKVKGQLNEIVKLSSNADMIIHAGDPDDEGQRLVDAVIEHMNFKGTVKRVLINDNNTEVVKKQLDSLKDNSEFKKLSEKALARSMADLMFGTNMTVAYSTHFNSRIFVGRVATSIFSLVVNRTRDHKNHVPSPFYELENIFNFGGNSLKAKLLSDISAPKDEENRIIKKEILDNFKKMVEGKNAEITSVEKKEKEQQPPLPFNLLKLQIEASKKFGYDADETLKITQDLREKYKLITYNRSDSQYLNEEHHSEAPVILNAVANNLSEYNDLISGSTDSNRKSRAFNDSKVTAHHGIIPTLKKLNSNEKLSEKEKNIYELIALRYIAQFLPLRKTEQTVINIKCDNFDFSSTATVEVDKGWRLIVEEENKEEEETFDTPFSQGDQGVAQEINVVEKMTRPKPLYTEASLLTDLTQVAKYIKDLNLKKALIEKDKDKEGERGGIGTPATRSSILKQLFERGYLAYDKKNIVPTKESEKIFDLLSDDIKYPDLTAKWQMKLNDIEDGNLSLQSFINEINDDIKDQIEKVKKDNRTIVETYPCDCGGSVTKKSGQYGTFWSCSNWKDCDIKYVEKDGKPVKEETYPCECGGNVRKMNGKNGAFWSCSNWKKCDIKYTEKDGKPVKEITYPCECGGTIRKIKGKGKSSDFWSCSNWKKCDIKYEDKEGKPTRS